MLTEKTKMTVLKFTVIKSKQQYFDYCSYLETLTSNPNPSKDISDEIELLTLLIEKWDAEHNALADMDPITLLRFLMDDHQLKAKDLALILNVSKGLVSDILHYKKGLSKEVIRSLAAHFKMSQDAFNRPYKLKTAMNSKLKNASVMNTIKNMEVPAK